MDENNKDILASIMAGLREEVNYKPRPVQYFTKGESMKVKLLIPEGMDAKHFWASYKGQYNGQENTYFLIACVILGANDSSLIDPKFVRYLKVPYSVLQKIVSDVWQDEWTYFEPTGPLFIIKQTNVGGKTAYSSAGAPPLKKGEKAFDHTGVEWPEVSITQAALDEQKRDTEKAAAGSTFGKA